MKRNKGQTKRKTVTNISDKKKNKKKDKKIKENERKR